MARHELVGNYPSLCKEYKNVPGITHLYVVLLQRLSSKAWVQVAFVNMFILQQ